MIHIRVMFFFWGYQKKHGYKQKPRKRKKLEEKLRLKLQTGT